MESFPKCIKAEMLPGVRLRLEFDNGQVRFFPVRDQLELLVKPYDWEMAKQSYGANLFIGNMATWMGNDIEIMKDGDVRLNQLRIPASLLWKYSLKHVNSVDELSLEEVGKMSAGRQIWLGFKRTNIIFVIIGLFVFIPMMMVLISKVVDWLR
ncbi:hypothetical protein [Lactococcus protaetiae]|uniref:Uncharacterized protein n=1 Tax=Lactococcus protaetiae TaxID=2592653 RepID=A0A514Z5V6_9LACT|nr:hypothetical protein [Lactococcus protaetiae]QDK69943.1 hypothetical protein FLP15_00620 [Lactococcus protaetiae]